MNDEKCNGWTNRETWTVDLWLVNDQDLYTRALDIAKHSPHVSDDIEALVRGMVETDGMAGDLITMALGGVNWDEIGDSFIEDAEGEA